MKKEQRIISQFCKKLVALDFDIFGLGKKPAQDDAKWITVHPGGKGRRADGEGQKGGTPVLIDSESGKILGGMGAENKGKTIDEVKQENKEKKLSQKQVAAISAKEQQKAYGKGYHDGQQAGQQFEKGESGALTAQGVMQAATAVAAAQNAGQATALLNEAETVLALPPTAQNKDAIWNEYNKVGDTVKKMMQDGDNQSKEFQELKEKWNELGTHFDKAKNDQYVQTWGVDPNGNTPAATGTASMTSGQGQPQQAQEEYSPSFLDAAQAKIDAYNAYYDYSDGKITKAEYEKFLSSWNEKLDALSDEDLQKLNNMAEKDLGKVLQSQTQPQSGGSGTGEKEKYSPAVQQASKLYWDYEKAIDDFDAGKITEFEKDMVINSYKNFKDAMSSEDQKAFAALSEEQAKEAASMFTTGVASGTASITAGQAQPSKINSLKDKAEAALALPATAQNEDAIYKQWEEVTTAMNEMLKNGGDNTPEFKEIKKLQTALTYHYSAAAQAKTSTSQTQKTSTKQSSSANAPVHASGEYTTPLGELSPVPANLMSNTGSKYLQSLKNHNFPTKENPTGYDNTAQHAKQGFSQAAIPTQSDLVQKGIYGDKPQKGYFQDVPHIKNAHPDLVPPNGTIDIPEKSKNFMFENGEVSKEYRAKMHNNVPYASEFGSASGRAAAWAYTAQSNTLNRILRGKPIGDDLDYKDDAAQVTKELDKILSVSRTKEPMVVYRGISGISAKKFEQEFALGKERQEKNFMSTSIDANESAKFSECLDGYGLYKIIVPKGASAVSLRYQKDGSQFSKFPHEDEILLPRNTRYRVIGFEKGTGYLDQFEKIPIVEIIQ